MLAWPLKVEARITNKEEMMTKACVKSTCPYCGVGCGVDINQEQITGDAAHPANRGSLCVKGSALKESLAMPSRLLYPKLAGKEVSWDHATTEIADRFHQAITQYGPDAVAMYVSGQILTEDYYVANKLMKGYVGSANIDTNSRLCMSSAVAAHVRAFGEDVVPVNYNDIDTTDLIIIIGANTAWTHPILFKRIQKARDLNPNLKLVVIDPRKTVTAEQADLYIPICNDGDVTLYNGVLRYLIDNDGLDSRFIEQHTNGYDALFSQLSDSAFELAQVSQTIGVELSLLETFCQWFKDSPTALTLFCQGVNQSESGVDKGNAIINAHLISGKIGVSGSGPFSLTGQPNAMGGREVGGLANQLAVHRGFDPESVALVQQFWRSPTIATKPGFKAVELFDAVDRGEIKVIWIMATNPVVSMPNADLVRRALEKCEFVIVSDITADSDVADYADLLLPAAGWGEKQGMVTNSERRMSRQRQFITPPGAAQADWWAVSQVGAKLCDHLNVANGFEFMNAADVFREYAAMTGINRNTHLKLDLSAVSDMSDEEYEAWVPTKWPLGRSAPYSDLLFSTPSGRANFVLTAPDSLKQSSLKQNNGWWLNTGRQRDQWHTMTRTGHIAKLAAGEAEPTVYMNSKSAAELGIARGEIAKLTMLNSDTELLAKAEFDEGLVGKQLFMSMHWAGKYSGLSQVNRVVQPQFDPISGQPAFKSSPVMISAALIKHYALFVGELRHLPNSDYFSYQQEELCGVWRYASAKALAKSDLLLESDERQFTIDTENGWMTIVCRSGSSALEWSVIGVLIVARKPIGTDYLDLIDVVNKPLKMTQLLQLANSESSSKLICSCYRVTDQHIKQAMAQHGCHTLDKVQAQLKCGTNCGSCLPEVKKLVAEYQEQIAIEMVK
jgi:assimilatory nitrate reductase catalytic subunit